MQDLKNVNSNKYVKLEKFKESKKTSIRFFKKTVFVIGGATLYPQFAFAAGSDAVTNVIKNVTDWLSGTPAVALGVLAVVYSGYEMLQGEIDKRKLMTRCVAIGLIIGGSFIGNSIIMNGIQ